MQVLPVDPGSQVVHNSLLDLLLDSLVCLSLQLQRLVVILPLNEKTNLISLYLVFACERLKHFSHD